MWDSTYTGGGACVPCAAGCAKCTATKLYECYTAGTPSQSCPTGFETKVVNNTNTGCIPCPAFCKTCASGVCSVCRDDYILSSDGKCLAKCKSPCQTCNAGAPTQCTSCIGQHVLSGNTCNPDLSCNNAVTCTSCPIGYNLMSGLCVKC